MSKPNNTTDASRLPCWIAVWGCWSLSGILTYSATPTPISWTPRALGETWHMCREVFKHHCLEKEVPLSCSSFIPLKVKHLMVKWLSFLSWIWNFCNQEGLLPSVRTWRWRLLTMHLLPRVLAFTSFQVSKANHFYGLLWYCLHHKCLMIGGEIIGAEMHVSNTPKEFGILQS